ncbi:MAG: phosphotransferase [Deltaproteobacteria bacterium]|nr:phosphotransferase [Deltaproteobacteria bacterium]
MAYTPEQLLDLLRPLAHPWLGDGPLSLARLGGDASSRVYHRLRGGAASLIVMELGPDPLRCEEFVEGEAPTVLPFFEIHGYLAAGGVPVPALHGYLPEAGLLLLEDLGDQTFESVVLPLSGRARQPHYEAAIGTLCELQRYTRRSPGTCIAFRRQLSPAVLRTELDHFREWLLEVERGVHLPSGPRRELDHHFAALAQALAELPQVFVHRDYQSRNLMVPLSDRALPLRVLDFQDALLGPCPYDLVALLRDSYVDLGVALVEELLRYYLAQGEPALPAADFERAFWLQTVQRKLKDAGRFVYLHRAKGNAGFLPHIPRSLKYVAEAFDHLPELVPLRALLSPHLPELAEPAARAKCFT